MTKKKENNLDRQTGVEPRLQWIDALKGYGIFCVTLAHLNPWLPIETHIYSYHMFLFFFISGYLYKKQELGSYIRRKAITLLVPFWAWNSLSSAVELLITRDLADVAEGFFVVHGKLCWNAPIWFLLTLFLCEVVYALADNLVQSRFISEILLFVSMVAWFLCGEYNTLPLKLNLLPLALFGFSYGHILRRITWSKQRKIGWVILILCVSGVASILFGAVLNQRISYTGAVFGNFLYCGIAALSGCGFFTTVFKNFKQIGSNRILCRLGRNSLVIMAAQYWFFQAFDFIGWKVWGISLWHARNTCKAVILSIITICLILAGAALLRGISRRNQKVQRVISIFGIR